jgi:transcriptional regulator with XRE-family HTH domain
MTLETRTMDGLGRGPDSIARRIRERRLARGFSLLQLAKLSALKSPSYIFHIENGHKVPSEEVAARLARALEDDESLYRAWSQALSRTDLTTTMSAAILLHRLLGEPLPAVDTPADPGPGWGAARLVVPVIPEGDDPGDGLRPSCAVLDRIRLDPATLRAAPPLVRPFAWLAGASDAAHSGGAVTAGAFAVFTRRAPDRFVERPCAVRREGRLVTERVWWNGRVLVLLPGETEAQPVTLPAEGEAGLAALVVGQLATLVARPRIR